MCELLGMSANVPTDICFSFTGLMQRGGRTGPHRDGWGIGLYEGAACRLFHDPRSSVASEIADLIQRYSIRSEIVVTHIRQANRGRVCLANTHPFARELWGHTWVFAHNGQLTGIKRRTLRYYKTIGTTDSEHAFCWMLDQIRAAFPGRPRSNGRLWALLHDLALDLDSLGTFNVLMSDGRYLYVYCSTRMCWITRQHPFGLARLSDTGLEVDFSLETTPRDVVTMIASRKLTDNEEWTTMAPGSLLAFRHGKSHKIHAPLVAT